MQGLRRHTYTPCGDVSAGPPLENLRRAQGILRDVPLPARLGRSLQQHEHVLRQSSYLSKVWEAFRVSVNEKDVLISFLRDVVAARLDPKRRDLALLDIGSDDGQLALQLREPFAHMTLVEADPQSFARLEERVCGLHRENGRVPDCRTIHDRFPCEGLGRGVYDLALMLHVLYYIPRDRWIESILAAYETLRPGGMLVVAYVCDEAAMAELLDRFGGVPLRFGEFETACHQALPGAGFEAYRMASVMCALEENGLAHLLGFLMADSQATGTAEEVAGYVRRFRRLDGRHVWKKTDGALIITRPA